MNNPVLRRSPLREEPAWVSYQAGREYRQLHTLGETYVGTANGPTTPQRALIEEREFQAGPLQLTLFPFFFFPSSQGWHL